jgi:hypothetical protein
MVSVSEPFHKHTIQVDSAATPRPASLTGVAVGQVIRAINLSDLG